MLHGSSQLPVSFPYCVILSPTPALRITRSPTLKSCKTIFWLLWASTHVFTMVALNEAQFIVSSTSLTRL